jgi:hypothetical protein
MIHWKVLDPLETGSFFAGSWHPSSSVNTKGYRNNKQDANIERKLAHMLTNNCVVTGAYKLMV